MILYNYHKNSNTLIGYENRAALVPELALALAIVKESGECDEKLLKAIGKKPITAALYAYSVVKHRIPEFEETIASYPFAAWYYYAKKLNERIPTFESDKRFLESFYAVEYAKAFLDPEKGFPEAEPYIAKSAHLSYSYSKWTNRRFELGEPALAESDDETLISNYEETFKISLKMQ